MPVCLSTATVSREAVEMASSFEKVGARETLFSGFFLLVFQLSLDKRYKTSLSS